MPLIGFACPNSEKKLRFQSCFKCKDECMPISLRRTIVNENMQNVHKGDYLSATALLFCMRKTLLERRLDYFSTVKNQFYAVRGNIVHRMIGRPSLNILKEQQFTRSVMGIPLHATIDEYHMKEKKLTDWKTVGDRGMSYIIKGGPKPEHVQQVNIYKWVMAPEYEVESINIVYMSFMEVVTVKAPIWEDSVIYAFMAGKVPTLHKAFTEGVLPQGIKDSNKKWLCKFCGFVPECAYINEHGLTNIKELENVLA